MPDIKFVNSPKTERDRLRHTRGDIVSGWFARQGFVVVPSKIKGVSETVQVLYPTGLVYQEIGTAKWEKEWELVGEQFFRDLDQILPGASQIWERVVVRLTRYGTVSSSANPTKYRSDCGVFYLRCDVDISHLAAMIVNIILYLERNKLGISWTKREALMDFVMTRPAMRKLFPHFEPVYAGLLRVPASLKKKSVAYVGSLGLSPKPKEIFLRGRQIWLLGKDKPELLPKQEQKLLIELLRKEGGSVSYDELADALWGEGHFHTFWAISKLVARARSKLAAMGVAGKIVSIRGVGYYFG